MIDSKNKTKILIYHKLNDRNFSAMNLANKMADTAEAFDLVTSLMRSFAVKYVFRFAENNENLS